ncbi:hypothetical protein ACJMK2_039335 [Sinanodonta woodiana]|uniref:RING-type domain-containing protein n=1 Tax=Sinanodonta woodiana TaxID=1069815 RepID=A0ABD3WEY0_SINWO
MAEGGICKNIIDSNCPICLETLIVPRVLPCQHTFCQKCLTSFIVNHADNQGGITSFSCPVCRSTILPSVQNEDLKLWAFSFPQNATILTPFGESKMKVDYVCDSCITRSDSKKADGYCMDCNQFFCENCIDFHSKFKLLKTHTVLKMDELHQTQSTAVVTSVEVHCKVHVGKEIEYFCNAHETVLCEMFPNIS